jgi:hypothetical protein
MALCPTPPLVGPRLDVQSAREGNRLDGGPARRWLLNRRPAAKSIGRKNCGNLLMAARTESSEFAVKVGAVGVKDPGTETERVGPATAPLTIPRKRCHSREARTPVSFRP